MKTELKIFNFSLRLSKNEGEIRKCLAVSLTLLNFDKETKQISYVPKV